MSNYDYDLFVIGAGSGGVRASRIAASHGAKVAVAEDMFMGGTCVNIGCVPKKLLVYAAKFAHDFEDAVGFGWDPVAPEHSWQKLIAHKNTEIQRLNGIYRNMLQNAGVEVIDGRATVAGAHEVLVNGKTYTAERILVAVGGWPVIPEDNGAKELAITSNEAFYLDQFPKKIVIVGGGYIAVEFASIFHALGAQVSLIYRRELFLRGFDDDIRQFMAETLRETGIDLRFQTTVSHVSKVETGGVSVELSTGDTLEADQIMYATGRAPKTQNLGLESVGVSLGANGAIQVDEAYQTSVPSIYAIGDVTDRIQLTPVALAEGHVLADRLYGHKDNRFVSYENIPTAMFSLPPVATVGLTEAEALEKGHKVSIFTSKFRPMKHTLSGRTEKTFMKLVVDTETDIVLGVHMAGDDAAEMLQGFAVALVGKATKAQFDATIGIHPTAAEEFVTMRTPTR